MGIHRNTGSSADRNAYFAADYEETSSGQVMLKVEEFADEFRAQVARELRAQVEAFWSAIDHPRGASLRDRRL